jgi:hypothetical protein
MCGPFNSTNHEIQIIGSTDRYWKLKNTYGNNWGVNGYLFLDKSQGLNCLNVCMEFSYPTGLPTLSS